MSTPICRQEVRVACEGAAYRLGIPYSWIKHHVDQKAGKVCFRCDGSGDYKGVGECFRCKGTGGASREAVEDALYWIEHNKDHILNLGKKREVSRQELQEQWKTSHPRHWWALRNMEPSKFKQYLMECLEGVHRGRMKPHMGRLLKIADELEAAQKGRDSPAPKVGASINVPVSIRFVVRAPFVGLFADDLTTIEFDTDEGWSGRVETRDMVTITKMEHRPNDYPYLQGVVKWSRGAQARVGDAVFYWEEKEE